MTTALNIIDQYVFAVNRTFNVSAPALLNRRLLLTSAQSSINQLIQNTTDTILQSLLSAMQPQDPPIIFTGSSGLIKARVQKIHGSDLSTYLNSPLGFVDLYQGQGQASASYNEPINVAFK